MRLVRLECWAVTLTLAIATLLILHSATPHTVNQILTHKRRSALSKAKKAALSKFVRTVPASEVWPAQPLFTATVHAVY
jgi:hypothetical protein